MGGTFTEFFLDVKQEAGLAKNWRHSVSPQLRCYDFSMWTGLSDNLITTHCADLVIKVLMQWVVAMAAGRRRDSIRMCIVVYKYICIETLICIFLRGWRDVLFQCPLSLNSLLQNINLLFKHCLNKHCLKNSSKYKNWKLKFSEN